MSITLDRVQHTLTPARAAVAALGTVALVTIVLNLLVNRPNHDHVAGIDLLVAAVNIVLAGIVFGIAARVWQGERAAATGLVFGILVVITAPVWYYIAQPVFAFAAIGLGLSARNRDSHPTMSKWAIGLGLFGLLIELVIIGSAFVSYLTK